MKKEESLHEIFLYIDISLTRDYFVIPYHYAYMRVLPIFPELNIRD